MTAKAGLIWTTLLVATGMIIILYLYFTLFPGKIPASAWQYFNPAEAERARQYQQIMRLAGILAFLTKIFFLVWLIYSARAGDWSATITRLTRGNYYLSLVVFFILFWTLLKIIGLPFSFYSSYIVQHQWGFATQNLLSWIGDYLKTSALDFFLTGTGVVLLFSATGRWPHTWWAAAGFFMAAWLFISTFLWPLLIAPLFNTFQPVKDEQLKNVVTQLAGRAGMQVGEVLVMDASRRTTKANAYFTGLGATKRIVLYDNLVNNYSMEEVKAVVAHEIAHWKHGHITRGLLWGTAGVFFLMGLLFLILKLTFAYEIARPGPYPPHLMVAMVLFLQLVTFLGQPAQNYISRSYEVAADRTALELTGNPEAMVRLQVNLAQRNYNDIAPPSFIEWLTYTHPPALARVLAVESEMDRTNKRQSQDNIK